MVEATNSAGEGFVIVGKGEKIAAVPPKKDGTGRTYTTDRARLKSDLDKKRTELGVLPSVTISEINKSETELYTEEDKINRISKVIDAVFEEGKEMAQQEFTAQHVIMLGATVEATKAKRKREIKFATASPDIQEYFNLLHLQGYGYADLRIGDISLLDIVNPDEHHPPSLQSIARYFMESFLMQEMRNDPDESRSQSGSIFDKKYPNIIAGQLGRLAYSSVSAYNPLDQKILDTVCRKYPDFAKSAKEVRKQMDNFYQRFETALFDPAHPDFSATQEMLGDYLSQDKGINFLTVNFLTRGGTLIQDMYRKAKNLETHAQYGDFYKRFADLITEYGERTQSVTGVLLYPDLESIFTSTDEESSSPIPLERFQTISQEISKKSGIKEYTVDPADVTWGNMMPPAEVNVLFNKNNNQNFAIQFVYKSDEEDLDFRVEIDKRKNVKEGKEFTWNFLEAPDDERMRSFYATVLSSIESVLKDVDKQAADDQRQRTQSRNRTTYVETKRVGPRNTQQPEPEVEEVPRKRRRQSPMEELFQDPNSPERIRSQIIIPDNLQSILPPGADVEQVRRRLEAFNSGGAGFIKPLVKSDELSSFRVGSFRVLLKEDPSDNPKLRRYTIDTIGNRRDVYRKVDKGR